MISFRIYLITFVYIKFATKCSISCEFWYIMEKYSFSWKFYTGIVLVISSFLIGKITVALFFLHPEVTWRISLLIVYLFSWLILFVGLIWVGTQYGEAVKRYMSYRFYHESFKKGTRKVVGRTKEKTLGIKNKIKSKKKV